MTFHFRTPRSVCRVMVMVLCMLLTLTFTVTVKVNVVQGQAPLDIGSRMELFVDDYLIESMDGVAPVLHRPTPREVVIDHNEPWEGSGCGYHTVFQDGNIFRMYYKAWQLTVRDGELLLPHDTFAAYAESDDGIHWKKPELGLFEYNNSMKNNIVWVGPASHDFTPFKDANPDCQPDAVYKAIGMIGKMREGLAAFKSADGIHWSQIGTEPIITDGAFDSQNLAFWDTVRGEYRAYFRDFRDGQRDIKTATSKDIVNWSEPVWLEYPGAPDEQLYTNQIKPYYRAPHIFIGFPTRYVDRGWTDSMKHLPEYEHRKLRAAVNQRYGSALTDALFMTSRDGRTFLRHGEAFLRPGLRNTDNWAYGDNYIAWHIIETKSDIPGAPDELSLYATESYWTGNSSLLRRYTLRIDGFVSVQAPLKGGEFITKPIIFQGNSLVINFSTSAAGSVLIEIQDTEGRPVTGFSLADCQEIFGDAIDRTVSWANGSGVGKLAGKPVRLRFVMKDADLYSIQFRD